MIRYPVLFCGALRMRRGVPVMPIGIPSVAVCAHYSDEVRKFESQCNYCLRTDDGGTAQ